MQPLPVVSLLIAVADGACAKKPFVQALKANGRFVLSRLRKEAVFYDLAPARLPGQKGASGQYADKHKASIWATETEDWQPAC